MAQPQTPTLNFTPQLQSPTAITKAQNAVVTAEGHDFVVGQRVKFVIPTSAGMTQLNGVEGIVLSINTNDFTVNVDTRTFNDFVSVSATEPDVPQVLPLGSVNEGYVFTGGEPLNRVKGSFYIE